MSTTCPNLAPRRAGPLRGRHEQHSHVAQVDAVCQLPVVITQRLQRWLSEWSLAINVSKSTAIIFAFAGRRFIQPRPGTLFSELIELVEIPRYLGVALYTQRNRSPHIDQLRQRTAQE